MARDDDDTRRATALPHLCAKLRWKSRAHDVERIDIVAAVLATGGVTCTCVTTADAIGEDGRLVAPERCAPSRGCYVADPLVALAARNRGVA